MALLSETVGDGGSWGGGGGGGEGGSREGYALPYIEITYLTASTGQRCEPLGLTAKALACSGRARQRDRQRQTDRQSL